MTMPFSLHHARSTRQQPTQGVSLLELVVALSLAAVLAGVGVLAYQAVRERLRLSMATRQVVMDLKVARMRAVVQNVSYRLVFSVGRGGYRAQRRAGGEFADDGPGRSLPGGVVVVECTARESAISFRPRGTAGSFGTVAVANARGDTRRVVVDIAGRIRVE